MSSIQVDILCTGLEHIRRGYESFARECFDHLKDDSRLNMRLFKGSGASGVREFPVRCFPRDSLAARLISKFLKRSPYHVEQWTFLHNYSAFAKRSNWPQVVFTSDANLANFLYRLRGKANREYRVLFSNGGPVAPPFPEYDHIQQVAEPYLEEAISAGEIRGKHSLVPYGISIPSTARDQIFASSSSARQKLGLPLDCKILISVGNISAAHKRMDYVVREIAKMQPELRPYVLMVGNQDSSSQSIHQLAREMLGVDKYKIITVPYSEIGDYYAASDLFVLASLREGFGRVLLEASVHGLKCIVDDNAVMRYVLKEFGTYTDMRVDGNLTSRLVEWFRREDTVAAKVERLEFVEQRFSWQALRDAYVEMFKRCCEEQVAGC